MTEEQKEEVEEVSGHGLDIRFNDVDGAVIDWGIKTFKERFGKSLVQSSSLSGFIREVVQKTRQVDTSPDGDRQKIRLLEADLARRGTEIGELRRQVADKSVQISQYARDGVRNQQVIDSFNKLITILEQDRNAPSGYDE